MKEKIKEGRYNKLGRFDAEFFEQFIEILPSDIRGEYRKLFLEEIEKYSDKGRRKGEPENEGCIRELENIEKMDIFNPEIVGKWIKEHQHTKYQKENVKRERTSFFENF